MAKRRRAAKHALARPTPPVETIYRRIQAILDQARAQVARSVNTQMVRAYWLIGRELVEEEQRGRARAAYGEELIVQLAARLQAEFGRGYTPTNLRYMRLFYLAYPHLLDYEIHHAPRDKSETAAFAGTATSPVPAAVSAGALNPNLSWTHYRLLTKVESPHARSFYEIEAVRNHWSSRELERQMSSLLFERLARSRDKQGLMRLTTKGQEVQTPQDVIKDPLVLEFVGLPESPRLVESDLEEALITHLQIFLLELGKGFAFVARQRRITLEGDHFYVDLVFYHVILKCYVLLDLKVEKLTHADLGQMQLYVNYYDETELTAGDNPTIGLILCADKNDLMVRYTLGEGKRQIFASRYKLHLPTEKELAEEIRRELRQFASEDPETPRERT
jgi:predicted nuclease of restriction endonuclease-like (RecB) superfamily